MAKGLEQQKLAVQSGYWPLYRYDPRRTLEGKSPLVLDSKAPSLPFAQYAYNETRFSMLLQMNEERAEQLMKEAQKDVEMRWKVYEQLAALYSNGGEKEKPIEKAFA
jgi:pyruvate-ferredoxin/flavodoxin oxidoreductase